MNLRNCHVRFLVAWIVPRRFSFSFFSQKQARQIDWPKINTDDLSSSGLFKLSGLIIKKKGTNVVHTQARNKKQRIQFCWCWADRGQFSDNRAWDQRWSYRGPAGSRWYEPSADLYQLSPNPWAHAAVLRSPINSINTSNGIDLAVRSQNKSNPSLKTETDWKTDLIPMDTWGPTYCMISSKTFSREQSKLWSLRALIVSIYHTHQWCPLPRYRVRRLPLVSPVKQLASIRCITKWTKALTSTATAKWGNEEQSPVISTEQWIKPSTTSKQFRCDEITSAPKRSTWLRSSYR